MTVLEGDIRKLMGENVDKKVILLNKLFLGSWLDEEEHIGHEVIDFFKSDDDKYYVYNNPLGVCPDNIWVEGTKGWLRTGKEKYVGKYMILTSSTKNGKFDILYVIELAEKLHKIHASKSGDKNSICQERVKTIIKDLNIKYNGKYLYDIYSDNSLYVTFRGSRIYKAGKPLHINDLVYKFQRNKGYIYGDKYPTDYTKINTVIQEAITNGSLKEYHPKRVNDTKKRNSTKTFLKLAGIQNHEQAYTNILYSFLNKIDIFKAFCKKFSQKTQFVDKGLFRIGKETKIVAGRMDICAESTCQRVVIENKVFSGLNGKKPEDAGTQLRTYYNWANEKDKPICFIVAPDFRIVEIQDEIEAFDKEMLKCYTIIKYSDVANFIEDEVSDKKKQKDYPYSDLIKQSIACFRNMATTKEELYANKFLEETFK